MDMKRVFKFVLVIALWVGFTSSSWSEETTDQTPENPLLGSWERKGISCGFNNPIVGLHPQSISITTYNPDGTMTLEGKRGDCSIIIESVYIVSESSLEVENTDIKLDKECFENEFEMNEEAVNQEREKLIKRIGLGVKRIANYTFVGETLYIEDPRPSGPCEDSRYNFFEKL